MTLEQAGINEDYENAQILMEGGTKRRLEALGMIPGTKIIVLNRKKNGTLIVIALIAIYAGYVIGCKVKRIKNGQLCGGNCQSCGGRCLSAQKKRH